MGSQAAGFFSSRQNRISGLTLRLISNGFVLTHYEIDSEINLKWLCYITMVLEDK